MARQSSPRPTVIGVVSALYAGFYYGGLLKGIREVAREHNVHLVALQTLGEHIRPRRLVFEDLSAEEDAKQSRSRFWFDEQTMQQALFGHPFAKDYIDGWLLVNVWDMPEDYVRSLIAGGAPAVPLCSKIPGLTRPEVQPDNYGGISQAVEHLLEHGHRKIAFVGYFHQEDIVQRYDGYCRAMRAAGIEPDPSLVIQVEDNLPSGGHRAAERLIAAGMPCTAVVCATDFNALGLISVLQDGGYRIPEDVAVTGFDDVANAQQAQPPLTTVRPSFEAIGAMGARLLLAELGGEQVATGPHRVPTALIKRGSCGCKSVAEVILSTPLRRLSDDEVGKGSLPEGWKEELSRELVRILLYPLEPDPAIPPEHDWPGVMTIVDGLEAALLGGEPPSQLAARHVWDHAAMTTTNLEVDQALLTLLEQSTGRLVSAHGQPEKTLPRVRRFLYQMRLAVAQARWNIESMVNNYFGNVIQRNYDTSLVLLETEAESARTLRWLSRTTSRWGALGLWSASGSGKGAELVVAGTYSSDGQLVPPIGAHYTPEQFPPVDYVPPPEWYGEDVLRLIPIRTPNHDWGVLALVGPVEVRFPVGHDTMTQAATMMSAAMERESLLHTLQEQKETLRDVNRQLLRAKEVAEEANQLKTQFLSNMSHELRTPLNAILNFTRFLGDPDISDASLTEQQQMYQQRVLVNGEHLLGLINDLLDLAKIEANKMELICEKVDLLPLIRGVMATAIGLTKDKEVDLQLELPEDALPIIWADKVRIRQVLLNMLSNAAKFTREGSITVRAMPTGSGLVEISVQDTGIGIAPEKQHLVFEEFRQVDNAGMLEQTGTGLGMPISKKFVELHGGQMWLESAPGVGSTFFFTVPIAKEAGGSIVDAPSATVAGEATQPLVVVVDDDEDSQRILAGYLVPHGFAVEGILDSRQAFARIQQLKPQLILLDIEMPHVDGWALLRQLHETRATASIPVVICSVRDNQSLGIAMGAHGYLLKPIRPEELIDVVHNWVRRGGQILVVDDDDDARQVTQTLLEQAGYEVLTASNGADGLEMVERDPPGLVILDLMMPEMDGFEFLSRVRGDPALSSLPVLVLSAKELTGEEHVWLLSQCQAYVRKAQLSESQFIDYVRALTRAGSLVDDLPETLG